MGTKTTDNRGTIIENTIINKDLILMNKGENPTHYSFAYKSFSIIDLTIISPQIADRFDWYVCDDLHSSDHFPVITTILNTNITGNRRPTWKIESADWKKYNVNFDKDIDTFKDINELESYIKSKIIIAAEKYIPKASSKLRKKMVPWWSKEINDLINKRKKLLVKFRRNQDMDTYKEFLKTKHLARKSIREAKKKSWEEYVESINSTTPSKEVYDKIKRINGNRVHHNITHIKENNINITDKKQISDLLGHNFSKVSSSSNFTEEFNNNKTKMNLSDPTRYKDNQNENFNSEITLDELEFALGRCKGSSPGPDNIRYEFVKNMSQSDKLYLLKFYNMIWTKQVFPSAWKDALVIPILKPGKDPSNKDNYRPISLTNCLCKLLERIVNN